jgi:hypothetical protein
VWRLLVAIAFQQMVAALGTLQQVRKLIAFQESAIRIYVA